MKTKALRAFSLVELLVVIAIIAILAAVLTPIRLCNYGRLYELNKSREIWRAMDAEFRDTGFSPSSAYGTSTAYFRRLVTSQRLLGYRDFAIRCIGVTCTATNADDFTGKNNAWNIVADYSGDEADSVPLLFTKNLDILSMSEIKNQKDSLASHLKDKTDRYGNPVPFEHRIFVMITKGGAGYKLDPAYEGFNVFGLTNAVLPAGP